MSRAAISSIEQFDAWDRWEENQTALTSREDLFAGITAADHVGTTNLVPHLTIIPDMAMPLAVRCDAKFNVTQALYGIVRAGSQGFALSYAYGSDKSRGKLRKTSAPISYITQLNDDPHGKRTEFVAPLLPGATVLLGGESKLAPEVSLEGLDFMIHADEKGEVRIKAKKLRKLPFQLITAISPMSHRDENDYMPLDEVGTWSLPPRFLKRVLKLS